MTREEIIKELSSLAERTKESNQSVSCILHALCGSVILGLERDFVDPVVAVTLNHLSIAQDGKVLSAEVIGD